ncbi:hypothetical protein LIT38_04375 [Bacillus sp. CMF12]|uniref:hypothetical protein n=1 Tax=Bacillaceae TaxID=186817 RepID=UPI001FB300E2|nr:MULTISPECIES: hypothetical protein [Bacillaceae]UOE56219.1 hypothetical protein IRB79_05545 [Cytobacillus oceanisediminis]USK50703.1 hypothetical protein LIT38_04375 [Bacillus sp. CMF12]
MMSSNKNGCDDNCPPRPLTENDQSLTFSNCVPVSGTSSTTGNIVFIADPEIDVTMIGSFESTNGVGFNALIVFNSGPSMNLNVPPGDSATFIFNDIREIALFPLAGGQEYTGIFKYKVTFTFEA